MIVSSSALGMVASKLRNKPEASSEDLFALSAAVRFYGYPYGTQELHISFPSILACSIGKASEGNFVSHLSRPALPNQVSYGVTIVAGGVEFILPS